MAAIPFWLDRPKVSGRQGKPRKVDFREYNSLLSGGTQQPSKLRRPNNAESISSPSRWLIINKNKLGTVHEVVLIIWKNPPYAKDKTIWRRATA